jgi:hypothetical protein
MPSRDAQKSQIHLIASDKRDDLPSHPVTNIRKTNFSRPEINRLKVGGTAGVKKTFGRRPQSIDAENGRAFTLR